MRGMEHVGSQADARGFDLAGRLAAARVTDSAVQLASEWRDGTVRLRLPRCRAPDGLGAHLRRSFLGALAAGASDEARRNLPCPWDPPCALDVFLREQMRGPRGDGLPKPYVIFFTAQGQDLVVELRVFGMACGWLDTAAEAMVAGLRDILPWQRVAGHAPPVISHRQVALQHGVTVRRAPARIGLEFLSPVDISGTRQDPGRSIVSRIIRRVSAVSRWQGMVPGPEVTRGATDTLDRLQIDAAGLRPGAYHSPNRKAQRRAHDVCRGVLWVSGDLGPLWPLLLIGERCHAGRAAVEGLGRYRIRSGGAHG